MYVILLRLLHFVPFLDAQQVTDPPPGYGVPHRRYIISPEWETLFSIGRNLTFIYKNPLHGYENGQQLKRTAKIYLEELVELDKAVEDNRFRSLDAVWELYINGGPLHLKQIPYDVFIKMYNWGSKDIDEYYTIIDDTRRIWSMLVEELGIIAESELVI